MVAVVVAVAIVLILAAIGGFAVAARRSREPVAPEDGQRDVAPPRASFGPAPSSTRVVEVAMPELFDLDLDVTPEVAAPADVEIRWSKRFDPRSGTLDDTARLRLIGDLGVVGKEWCVPLLTQAYAEERRPGNRQAALIALATCRSRMAIPTYRLALTSDDAEERAIAADALLDLEPPASAKQRTVVERR